MDLKEIDILGNEIFSHWYYKSKAMTLHKLLGNINGNKFLDIGAGSGFFSRFFLQNTGAECSTCVDPAYPKEYSETIAGKQLHFAQSIESSDADIILMTDVLEHIEDDISFLRSYKEKTKDNARFLITVPAFQFLWSGHDVFLGHYRRYTLKQLENIIRKAGLTPQLGCYYFANVFPAACATRLLSFHKNKVQSSLSQHSVLVNKILMTLCRVEHLYVKWNRLLGLTACCVARRT
jgi:SAM-dependent methyltransferase